MSVIDDINNSIIQAKNDWWDANARGDQAGMDTAHATAESLRDAVSVVAAGTGIYGRDGNSQSPILQIDDDVPKPSPPIFSPPSYTYDTGTSDTMTPTYSSSNSSPYIPPKPSAPAAPPQSPPEPGTQPTFTSETQKQIVKYEYMYGIKDIQIKGNEFTQKSIYVSQPVIVDGNIMEVSLTSVEDHPVFNALSGDAASRQTSVEYYIAYKDNPALADWHPILPESQRSVVCELLMFDSARTATLRFPALSYDAKVYKNGLAFTGWSFISGGMQVQLSVERDPASIYTIDYTPNAEIASPWVLDVYNKGVATVSVREEFPNGTNHNKTLVLSSYPYIDYSKINPVASFDPNSAYTPIKVTLTNAQMAGPNRTVLTKVDAYSGTTQPAYTYNVTDYKTKNWKIPKAYSLDKTAPYPAFEYWQNGNKLYFSETFNKADILTNQDINHGNATVVVEYQKLISDFRVKMVLRRNGAAANSVSPMVYQYALKFKAAK